MGLSRAALALLGIALLVSACGGGGGGDTQSNPPPPAPSPPPPPPPQPGSLQFQAASIDVNEDASTVTITITRTEGSDGAVSVAVASLDGSATVARDYTAVSTTVSFASGDTAAKTVTTHIWDDDEGEADETLTLVLSAPTGGATLGATVTTTLTIHDNDPPAAPALTLGANLKQLSFSWASVPGATSYRLLQDPDGHSGFTQVGPDNEADATDTTLEIAVHRLDWVHALYRLEACNAQGCTASGSTSALSAMLQAIGYFKASNTQAFDSFGDSVALSADGSTLAVGADYERSKATGVGGDQTDNSTFGAGAVYVFTRPGPTWSQQAYVKASNTEPSDVVGNFFGASVALSADGNTLAVGATYEASNATGVGGGDPYDNSASASGAGYVYTRAGTLWSHQAYVKASNTDNNDSFGFSLALSADGNTLAVSAPYEASNAAGVDGDQTDNSAPDAGAVYVY